VGVDGYLLKSATADELVDAIRAAYRGAQVVSREIAAHQAATVWQAGSTAAPHLSQRELEILCLVRDGSNNRKIADALQLSVRTVEAYLSHAMAKLGARSRAEAVNQAKHAGLMGDE